MDMIEMDGNNSKLNKFVALLEQYSPEEGMNFSRLRHVGTYKMSQPPSSDEAAVSPLPA